MSTLKVDTIRDTNGVEVYTAKAWVNFDGTFGTSPFTVANGGIRAAGNVSSITDRGPGLYTVNFITAMPDDDYCGAGTAIDNNGDSTSRNRMVNVFSQNASSAYINSFDTAGNADDCAQINVIILR